MAVKTDENQYQHVWERIGHRLRCNARRTSSFQQIRRRNSTRTRTSCVRAGHEAEQKTTQNQSQHLFRQWDNTSSGNWGDRVHCDMMDYFGTIQTGQIFRECMQRQMNRRHRRVFMKSAPIQASNTDSNSVMEIERQANNGWVNATRSDADQFPIVGTGVPVGTHLVQENNESGYQQMSLAEKEQILAAGTSPRDLESETNNPEEE